jgi:hypothetical protein
MTMALSPLSPRKFGYRFNCVGMIGLSIILFWAWSRFAPLVTPYPIGEIVDFDYFGPMSLAVLAGYGLSRPRHALAHSDGRALYRRHFACRRRHCLASPASRSA